MNKKQDKTGSKSGEKTYHHLLTELKQRLEHLDEQSVMDAVDEAKEVVGQLTKTSQQEIDNIAHYLKRDLHDAASYLNLTGEDLKRWLKFDWTLVEDRLWDTFSSVADKTALELMQLKFRLERGEPYTAGQVTGVGSLQCDDCGEVVQFTEVSTIKPCVKCKGKIFSRID